MEFLFLLLVLSPLAALFSGGDGDPVVEPDDDGHVDQNFNADNAMNAEEGKDNALLAGGGDDTVSGADGRDVLAGQAGDDAMSGGDNGDFVLGGAGNDTLYGNSGADLLVGGAGNDQMAGGVGNDVMFSNAGADLMLGGEGDDLLVGLDVDGALTGSISDIITPKLEADMGKFLGDTFGSNLGANQSDLIIADLKSTGAPGSDELRGGTGQDHLIGDAGDTLIGGAGDDRFTVVNGPGDAVVISGFDPAVEDIRIMVANTETGALTFADVPGGVELRIGGSAVAFLNGATASDLNPAQFVVERLAA